MANPERLELLERRKKYEQLKEEEEKRKYDKKARKRTRFRHLKNFLFVLLGIFLGLILLFGGIFVGVYFIPTKNYLDLANLKSITVDIDGKGAKNYDIDDLITEKVSSSSILEVIMNMGNYTIKDVPLMKALCLAISSNVDLIEFDVSDPALDQVKVLDFQSIFEYAKINPSALGEIANIGVFSYDKVPTSERPITEKTEYDCELYYYLYDDNPSNPIYKRAITDNNQYVNGVDDSTQLYYVSLADVGILDVMNLFDKRLSVVPVANIIDAFASETVADKIKEVFGDASISELQTFDFYSIKIESLIDYTVLSQKTYSILEGATDMSYDQITVGDIVNNFEMSNVKLTDIIEYNTDSKQIYAILEDATHVTYQNMLVNDVAHKFNVDDIRLINVIGDMAATEKLYSILEDATEVARNQLTILNVKEKFNVNNVKLRTIIGDTSSNKILQKLIDDNVKVNELDTAINGLSIEDIFEIECWTQDSSKTKDTYVVYEKVVEELTGKITYVCRAGEGLIPGTENDYYYISKNANIWFLILHSFDETYSDLDGEKSGLAKVYTYNEATYSNLEEAVKKASANAIIETSTVRQLYLLNIITEFTPSPTIYSKTIGGILSGISS